MERLQQFDFATIICDGCARRVDSLVNDEVLKDYADLVECHLPDDGWEQQGNDDDKWLCPECVKDESHRKYPGEGRVIIEPTTLSGLCCDLCGKHFENYEGYSCWEDVADTQNMARDDNWVEIDGKFYCPDCYQTCGAIADEEEEHYEEAYCSKCPYKDDCGEYWPREKPECSSDCLTAYKDESGNWCRCPHYKTTVITPYQTRRECLLEEENKGGKCPRVAQWEKDRVVLAEKNKALLEKITNLKKEAAKEESNG